VSGVAPIPVARYLVPAVAPPPSERFTRVRQPLAQGLPHTIQLDADFRLVVALPNGTARLWLDTDPAEVVSRSANQTVPVANGDRQPIGAVAQAPLRLFLVRDRTTLASIPLVAGLRRTVPDTEIRIELLVLGWDLRAGSLRGPGDFGSFVDLAWRRADRPGMSFEAPPFSPRVAARLGDAP
jgi:hypothetical protein